jgi:HSF-type DNA-binding
MDPFSFDEHAAASAVAALSGNQGKRSRDDSPDAAGGWHKISRVEEDFAFAGVMGPPLPPVEPAPQELIMNPYPFFCYNNFSAESDPDPLTPLTAPGRVPNFPAKMHSILSRPDLADVISWMPHGRSWRVLKPREFEIRVIPTYFEHAKFSSFIRQANGWGFRRVTQGRDRNSYYHELFLRGLPHLCKQMKRPGVSQKQASDPDHEPDLYKISEMHPVPEKAEDDAVLLQCTLQGGPKARMPIYSGSLSHTSSLRDFPMPGATGASSTSSLTPRDQDALSAFQQSLGASESQFKSMTFASVPTASVQSLVLPQQSFMSPNSTLVNLRPNTTSTGTVNSNMATLMAANQLAFASPNMAAAFQASSAASQFAAGFAAATALSHQQFQSMLGQLGVAGAVPLPQSLILPAASVPPPSFDQASPPSV